MTISAQRAGEIRAALGGGNHCLTTHAIPQVANLLGVTAPIVVISTSGHDGSNRFSVERIGHGAAPICLVNAADIHFGHAKVKPGFAVQDANADNNIAIRFQLVDRGQSQDVVGHDHLL